MADRKTQRRNLIVLLGDQLTESMSSLRAADPETDLVLLAEVAEEATYVPHHKKKIAFVFSAMRHFAERLRGAGWTVDYVAFGDASNSDSIRGEIERALTVYGCQRVVITEPGEWRLLKHLNSLKAKIEVPVDILEDDRFLCSKDEFRSWASGRRQLRMEDFYRWMRRRTGLLMDNGKPVGGRWNFDAENRKPAIKGLRFPTPLRSPPDAMTAAVLDLVSRRFPDHFGSLEPFWFAVTSDQARKAFDRFVESGLPKFGDYQDAMVSGEPFLFHSVVSLYLNVGFLDPLAVCRTVEAAYQAGDIPINAAEGFIRQIIGWREFVRGIYWLEMPSYLEANFFGHSNPLPDFYWNGDTEMACLRAAIGQTRDEAYAHHIQRLMITGNFAMLIGTDPKQVHEWYLAVYADAYEWVELPNTLGMSQFADGGLLASKPYAASGNYINKMSNYCASCRFKVKEKTGPEACPFNYLYWDFLDRNREKLAGNQRLGPVYRVWDKFDRQRQEATRRDAKRFLDDLFARNEADVVSTEPDTVIC